jgi:hypothetical protein
MVKSLKPRSRDSMVEWINEIILLSSQPRSGASMVEEENNKIILLYFPTA